MKKVQTSMYVFTGRPYGIAYDIEDLNAILNEIEREHGEEAMKEAHIINVTHETRADVFPLKYEAGELNLNDICYAKGDEGTFRVEDFDKEFDDEDDLRNWIQEQVRRGELDIDEVRGLEITYIEASPGGFEEAEQTQGEWRIDVQEFEAKHREAMDAMACEYVDASEAEKIIKELDKPQLYAEIVEKESKPVYEMTDEEINAELFAMLDRVNELQQEKRKREKVTKFYE